jgi:hypothetical protein
MAQGLKPHYRLIALSVPLVCVVIVVILLQMVAVSSSGGNVTIGQPLHKIFRRRRQNLLGAREDKGEEHDSHNRTCCCHSSWVAVDEFC